MHARPLPVLRALRQTPPDGVQIQPKAALLAGSADLLFRSAAFQVSRSSQLMLACPCTLDHFQSCAPFAKRRRTGFRFSRKPCSWRVAQTCFLGLRLFRSPVRPNLCSRVHARSTTSSLARPSPNAAGRGSDSAESRALSAPGRGRDRGAAKCEKPQTLKSRSALPARFKPITV
jgi:hypothetical protein